jgi:MFS family permease
MRRNALTGPFLRITAANYFFFLSFASFFLLPLHIKALGGSEAAVGAVMGTSGLASLLALPLVGLTIDRFGRRRFLIGGAAAMTVASVGFIFVEHIGPAMFALRLIQGLGFATAFTATTTFAAAFAPRDRRAQALGIFGLSTLLNHAIAPVLGEEIIRRAGFDALFATTAFYNAVVILLSLRLPRGRTVRGEGGAAELWRMDPIQWVLAATVLLTGMGFGSVITFIPTYVRTESLGRVGVFFTAYATTAILSRLAGAGLSDSLGRRRVILPTLLALGASIFTLSLVHNVPLLILAGALFGSAQGINYPTMHAFLVDLTSDDHMGRAQALFNGAFNLGVTCSAFAFGFIAEHMGHRTMFAVSSLTPLAAWVVFYWFGRAHEQRPLTQPALSTVEEPVIATSHPSPRRRARGS